jgi:hypothetical protein
VNTGDLADDAVTSAKILDGEIKNADLAANAVTGGKIQNGSLTSSDIASDDGSGNPLVGSAAIVPGTINAGDCVIRTAGVTGIQTGDHVILSVPTTFTNGLTAEPGPGGSNQLQVRVCNVSNVNPSITDAGVYSFGYLVIH